MINLPWINEIHISCFRNEYQIRKFWSKVYLTARIKDILPMWLLVKVSEYLILFNITYILHLYFKYPVLYHNMAMGIVVGNFIYQLSFP